MVDAVDFGGAAGAEVVAVLGDRDVDEAAPRTARGAAFAPLAHAVTASAATTNNPPNTLRVPRT